MQNSLLIAENVAFVYPNLRENGHALALKNIDLTVNEGEFCSIVGKSGYGKTTLLKVLTGLLNPTSGRVMLEGAPVVRPSRKAGVVFQDYGSSLLPLRTVYRNIELALLNSPLSQAKRREKIEYYIQLVGLGDAMHLYPGELSGGMKQRVALARALAQEPDLLLLDEPFGSLDAPTRFLLEDELLRIIRASNLTVVLITHDIDEAIYLSDKVYVMRQKGTVRGVDDEIKIPLPKPREQVQARGSLEFGKLRAQMFDALAM